MRPFYHPQSSDISLAGVLYALGDPVRLSIVQQLADKGDRRCSEFDCGNVAKSTLSHHFKILRESGVVWTRKDGTQHINRLRREDLEERCPGLLAAVLRSIEASVKPMGEGAEGGAAITVEVGDVGYC